MQHMAFALAAALLAPAASMQASPYENGCVPARFTTCRITNESLTIPSIRTLLQLGCVLGGCRLG